MKTTAGHWLKSIHKARLAVHFTPQSVIMAKREMRMHYETRICGLKNFSRAWIDGSSNHRMSNITYHANSGHTKPPQCTFVLCCIYCMLQCISMKCVRSIFCGGRSSYIVVWQRSGCYEIVPELCKYPLMNLCDHYPCSDSMSVYTLGRTTYIHYGWSCIVIYLYGVVLLWFTSSGLPCYKCSHLSTLMQFFVEKETSG